MLIESLLAVIALITVAVLTSGEYKQILSEKGPVGLFADGIGKFLATLGLPLETGISFAALAVSAFALTSLDIGTRLARLSFQEFFAPKEKVEGKKASQQKKWLTNRFFGTLISVGAGGGLALSGQWKAIWPLFGTANQLLAALALLAVTIWMRNKKSSNWFTRIHMYFMYIMTTCALVIMLWKNIRAHNFLLSFCALLLLGVSISMVAQVVKSLKKSKA
jgi:carbon starvation protein